MRISDWSSDVCSSDLQAVTMLQRPLGIDRPAWTGRAPLPGGEMPADGFDAFLVDFAAAHPWLPAPLAGRYARAYGTRADRVLGGAASLDGLGEAFGDGLFEAERSEEHTSELQSLMRISYAV